ncbi:hypothetical protein D9615_009699 [Tricholomella constricta]|uniref:Uncharacterized protein n=1 Tax=Tricholomella constricta TaxID=117010 RepID=A0A8H5GUM8_9AGAR|nr:hypothetical protein D9615_009699 [Tricholomella constricta]
MLATFMAAIQAQVMSTTIGLSRDQETAALRAVNALFLSGLIICVMAAFLAFLTARWLQRLTDDERMHLEVVFNNRTWRQHLRQTADHVIEQRDDGPSEKTPVTCQLDEQPSFLVRLIHAYFAYSLFAPMTLLIIGVLCMTVGLLVLAWAEHSLAVAITLTVACLVVLPFPAGVFLIGDKRQTRIVIIQILSRKQGDF